MNASVLKGPLTFLTSVLAGTTLGAAVSALSIKAVLILGVIGGGVLLLVMPVAAYYVIIASTPFNIPIAGPLTVSRLVVVGGIAMMCLHAATGRYHWPINLQRPEAILALMFFGVILVSSMLHSGLGAGVIAAGPYIIYAAMFFVILTCVNSQEIVRNSLWVLVGTAGGVATLAILEARFGISVLGGLQAVNMEEQGDAVRASSTSSHPIALAGFFQIVIPMAIALLLWSKSNFLRLGLLAGLPILLYAWWNAYSRSSLIGVAAMTAAALCIYSRTGRLLVVAGAIGAFFVLAPFGFSIIAFLEFFDEIPFVASLVAKAGVSSGSETLLWRVENWVMGLGIIADHPILGVGVDRSEAMAYDYLPSWSTAHRYTQAALPHNLFIMVGADGGIPALALYLGLWFLTFRALIRAARIDVLRPYAKLFATIIIGQLAFQFMNPMFREVWLTMTFALALGWMSEAYYVRRVRPHAQSVRVQPERQPEFEPI